MSLIKKLSLLAPLILIVLLIVLAYSNIVILGRSLNPILLIPPDDIKLSTGYADIFGTPDRTHGWHVDLANPAYLEWPVNIFIGRSLKAGHIPLVLPYQNLGVPLIGQYCHRVLSPYQMVENLLFPRGYDFFIVLRLILAGWFTFLFVRSLCVKTVSALLAAVGYGLGSVMVIYSNHEEVSNVAMTLPLLMWAVRAFFDRPGLRRGCWLALALALVHTAGQPEVQLYLLFLAFLYGLMRLICLPPGVRKSALIYCLAAILFSAVIAAPQILLFLLFHQEAWTFHPPGGNLGLQSPMRIDNFLFTLFPKLRQTPYPWSYRTINLLWDWVGGYFGFGLLFLAAASARRPRRNRREIALFGFYFLFILAKNLGWSPAQMLGLLPSFDQTWSPRWAAATWSFALAVLAGLGLDNLLNQCSSDEVTKPRRQPRGEGRFTSCLANPLVSSAFLFAAIILAIVFWRQGRIQWEAERLREYVLFNGLLFFYLSAAAVLTYCILPRPVKNHLRETVGAVRRALVYDQIGMIALLSAVAFAAARWFPPQHYFFAGPEPVTAYLFAAPVLIASLFGLFYMAAAPSHPGTAVLSAVAIPSVFLGGWAELPTGAVPVIYGVLLGLAVLSFPVLSGKPKILRVILPVFSLPLLGGLVALNQTAAHFPTPEAEWILRLHCYFAAVLLAALSFLRLRPLRENAGSGWFFLILIWMELTIYIPKNHGDRYLLVDAIPFLITAAAILGCAVWFRLSPPSARRLPICLSAIFLLGGASLLVIESAAFRHLPERCTPGKPLPFITYLQDENPGALTGIGKILFPNFASAYGLSDLRGCVSMNTKAYQFFLENILQAVPRGNSYSLWFTGDNPILRNLGNTYGSSRDEHVQAFTRAYPFYILAGARYVLSPPGGLDGIRSRPNQPLMKIYGGEADIWEIPSLPPAYIAHTADVISMLSNTRRWGTTIANSEEILRGERVVLEEEPDSPLPGSGPSSSDRARLMLGENPNRFQIRFYTEQPGYLAVNRAYTNLLRAYLNGEDIPVLKANGPFIAVPVPGGREERVIEFTYLSPPVRWSFLLGMAGLLAVAAGLAAGGAGERKRRQASGARRSADRTDRSDRPDRIARGKSHHAQNARDPGRVRK
ncbi:MAG: hypothetical protein V1789_02505 [PVC group bacterium]